MQIDRSRFLLLSASIAAGCASQANQQDVKVATPIEMEPSEGDEPITDASQQADVSAGGPADDQSLHEVCDGLEPPPGPHCESFFDTKADCASFIDGLEDEAAERAVHCLASRSKTQAICRYDALQDCFVIGTSTTLPEPELTSRCAGVVKRCASSRWARGDLTLESCGSVMAAVKEHLQGEMISCMAEGCGLGSCVWRLR